MIGDISKIIHGIERFKSKTLPPTEYRVSFARGIKIVWYTAAK